MAKNKFHDGPGPSQRQLRVGELIRRTLSEVLMRGDIHDPDLNRLSITVGEVRVSPDLTIATAYVLPLGGGQQDEAIAYLARNKGELRRIIGKKAGLKHARPPPGQPAAYWHRPHQGLDKRRACQRRRARKRRRSR